MPLTAAKVKNFSCPEGKKQTKIFDGNGLFLLVKINGSKLWRFRFKYANKYQEIALGKYPLISLSDARELTKNHLILLAGGVNPVEERRAKKNIDGPVENSFGSIALQWWEQQKSTWSDDHALRVKRWMTIDTKAINALDIDKIDAGDNRPEYYQIRY